MRRLIDAAFRRLGYVREKPPWHIELYADDFLMADAKASVFANMTKLSTPLTMHMAGPVCLRMEVKRGR